MASTAIKSWNLESFAARLLTEDCRLMHYGDSISSEVSQTYSTIPAFIRFALSRYAGVTLRGCRMPAAGGWYCTKATNAAHTIVVKGDSLENSTTLAAKSGVSIDMSSLGDYDQVYQLAIEAINGGSIVPFPTPVFWDNTATLKARVTHHRTDETVTVLAGTTFDGSGSANGLDWQFRDAGDDSLVQVQTIEKTIEKDVGSGPGYTTALRWQTIPSTHGSNAGKQLTIYDVELLDPDYTPGDPGVFYIGPSRAQGGDTILNHLPSDYADTVANGGVGGLGPSGVYTDADFVSEINPGGANTMLLPNTFIVSFLNKHTPTEGGYSGSLTSGQKAAIVKHLHDFHVRQSYLMSLAGTPVEEQRWLYISPWTAWSAGGISATGVNPAARDMAEAYSTFARSMGSNVSFLDMQGIIESELGIADDWYEKFLADGIHPTNNILVDDPTAGTNARSMHDYWGRAFITAIQQANQYASASTTLLPTDIDAINSGALAEFKADADFGTAGLLADADTAKTQATTAATQSTTAATQTTAMALRASVGLESANLSHLVNAVVGKQVVTDNENGTYDIAIRNAADDTTLVTIRYNPTTGAKSVV